MHTRLRLEPRTRDYCDRRAAEGKRREIVRCLGRYVAREFLHQVRLKSTFREVVVT